MGIWLKRLSYLAVLGFPLAVVGTRFDWFQFRLGFTLITWTVYLALAVLVLGLIVSFWSRHSKPNSARAARLGALIALIPLVGIGSQLVTARSLPEIHNITTDTADPPQFDKLVAIRGEKSNPHEYDAATLAPQQMKAYPELETLSSSLSGSAAFTRAVAVAKELGWEVVAQDSARGMIEATDTTALWNFKDDIVIRIRPNADGTQVDLRSVSRVGRSDLGANAKRINRFIAAFSE